MLVLSAVTFPMPGLPTIQTNIALVTLSGWLALSLAGAGGGKLTFHLAFAFLERTVCLGFSLRLILAFLFALRFNPALVHRHRSSSIM